MLAWGDNNCQYEVDGAKELVLIERGFIWTLNDYIEFRGEGDSSDKSNPILFFRLVCG